MSTPLVLLHGFLGAAGAWDEVLRFAEPSGAVDAFPLPGHGPRPWIPGMSVPEALRNERSFRGRTGCTTFEAAVDAVAARLPARAHLVGYSMGARVALGVVARHPQRVASLVLVGLHPGLADDVERRARHAWEEELARDLETRGLRAFVDAWETMPMFASQRWLDASVRARRRAERLDHVPAALAWALRTLGTGSMPSLWDALAEVRAPVHLVTGARDEKFTDLARRALARTPSCLHTAVGGVGHDVGLEAPRALGAIIQTCSRGVS
jgi:2-succinyl-6-hydroxy-2,4-cyclohexadiene-1-carboxylate synthase